MNPDTLKALFKDRTDDSIEAELESLSDAVAEDESEAALFGDASVGAAARHERLVLLMAEATRRHAVSGGGFLEEEELVEDDVPF